MFDPSRIADDACAEGHLDADPVHQVLLALGQRSMTGRLTVADAAGDNHLYFMQGRPVGVLLAERVHPLGQLLLELGRVDGATFLKAQRLIAEGGRLPGQVFKELGVVDDASLKETLAIQARRKAEHFCRLGSRPFTFCKGLMYLNGFTSTPLDLHGVVFLAVRQQTGEPQREAFLESARAEQVRLVVPGVVVQPDQTVEHGGLPAAPSQYGFGPPEERFLARIVAGWESVADLAETGTLPRDEMAVLLRYLEVIGRLQRRPIPAARAVPDTAFDVDEAKPDDDFPDIEIDAPTPPSPLTVQASAPVPATPTPLPTPLPTLPPTRPPTLALPLKTTNPPAAVPSPGAPWAPPPPVFASPPAAALDAVPAVDEDVFALPRPATKVPPASSAARPDSITDPRLPVHRPSAFPSTSGEVFAPLAPAPAGTANPALHEPTPPTLPAPLPSEEDLLAPIVKKKKLKRSEPLPSAATAVMVSETRREKTMIKALPSIVIDED